ncbi:MAG TPA: hypothetical protein VGK35_08720 [Actinotalea sp.]|jgi:hypothetical protein
MAEGEVVVAVAAQELRVPVEAVIEAARSAVEDVAQRCMGIDLSWSTHAHVTSDDLGSARARTGAQGLRWDFIARKLAAGRPEGLGASAESTVMRADFNRDPNVDRYDPRMDVVDLTVSFPTDVLWTSRPVTGLTVWLSMSRWAMYGGGERLDWAAGWMADWVRRAAELVDADTGYMAIESAGERGHGWSGWESRHRVPPSYRDFRRYLYGLGWGVLLGPAQVPLVGGIEALRAHTPLAEELPGGRALLRLADDPASVTPRDEAALGALLDPVLPTDERLAAHWGTETPRPATPPPPPQVLVGAVGARLLTVPIESVLAAVRAAVEDVVLPSAGLDLTWLTCVETLEDADPMASPPWNDGLDWERDRAPLGEGVVEGFQVVAFPAHHEPEGDPELDPGPPMLVHVAARLPGPDTPGVGRTGELLVMVAVAFAALADEGRDLTAVGMRLADWVAQAAALVEAETGYIALEHDLERGVWSEWELDRGITPGSHDFLHHVWGLGWGVLLGPAQVEAVGGVTPLATAGLVVREVGAGRVWATLGDDQLAVTDEALAGLERTLAPLLPPRRD